MLAGGLSLYGGTPRPNITGIRLTKHYMLSVRTLGRRHQSCSGRTISIEEIEGADAIGIEHETRSRTDRTTLSFSGGRLLWRPWAGMGGHIGRGTERRRDLREASDDPRPD